MATTSSPGPSSTSSLPPLRRIDASTLDPEDTPALRIKTDEDVEAWKHTRGYQDYGLFLRRLAESVVGYFLPYEDPEPDPVSSPCLRLLLTSTMTDEWMSIRPALLLLRCSTSSTGGSMRSRRCPRRNDSGTLRSGRGASG